MKCLETHTINHSSGPQGLKFSGLHDKCAWSSVASHLRTTGRACKLPSQYELQFDSTNRYDSALLCAGR